MTESFALSALAGSRAPLISEEELIERGRVMPSWRQNLARFGFSARIRLDFYRALSVYRSQDIRENAALVNWWNVITARGGKNLAHPLAILIPVMLHAMHNQGTRWQSLFRHWVPSNDAMIITASERAGLTPSLLRILCDLSLAQRRWGRKINQAALPALINFIWLIALLAAIGLFYFPALQRSMPHMRMVGNIALLARISAFVNHFGIPLLLGLAALPVLANRLLRCMTGGLRASLDRLPGFSLYRQATGMTFLLGISALLEVGENFIDAVLVLRETSSPYVRERLDAILAFDNLRPADAMIATGFHWPDDSTLELLSLYMVTRSPQEGIRIIVDDWMERAGDSYARMAASINGVGQIITWAIVGWLYLVTAELTTTMNH